MQISVLDHGYVRLVDSLGTDASIIEAARMSVGGGFVSWEPYEGHPRGDAGLLEYLYRNAHSSPFEMCELVVEVYAPIFVMRQWERHRTQSYNEHSARYAPLAPVYYLPSRERMARQSTKHTQSSGVPLPVGAASFLVEQLRSAQVRHELDYQLSLDYGLAREVARLNTPVSQYTRVRCKANLRNWLSFLGQRLKPGAQLEIREYALALAKIVAQLWPRTWSLFEEYDLHGRRYSRSEIVKHVEQTVERDALRAALRQLLEARDVGGDDEVRAVDAAVRLLGDNA